MVAPVFAHDPHDTENLQTREPLLAMLNQLDLMEEQAQT